MKILKFYIFSLFLSCMQENSDTKMIDDVKLVIKTPVGFEVTCNNKPEKEFYDSDASLTEAYRSFTICSIDFVELCENPHRYYNDSSYSIATLKNVMKEDRCVYLRDKLSNEEIDLSLEKINLRVLSPIFINKLILPENLHKSQLKYLNAIRVKDLTIYIPEGEVDYLNPLDFQNVENLKKLTIRPMSLGNGIITKNNLRGLSHIKHLKSLEIENLFPQENIEDFEFITNQKNLESLKLSSSINGNIAFLKEMKNLKKLSFKLRWFDEKEWDLSVFDHLVNLTHFEIEAPESFVETKNLTLQLKKHTTLRHLKLKSLGIKDYVFLNDLTNLESLELDSIGDFDLSPLTRLSSLEIQGLEDLAQLKNLVNLEKLSFKYAMHDDYKSLANLTKLKFLEISNVNNNNVTDLASLKKLEVLKASFSSNVNLQFLSSFENLLELTVYSMYLTSMLDLPLPKNLTNLRLITYSLNDLRGIPRMKKLSHLSVTSGSLQNLNGLEQQHQIKNLNIFDTAVTDLEPIKNLFSLVSISFNNSKVTNCPLDGNNLTLKNICFKLRERN